MPPLAPPAGTLRTKSIYGQISSYPLDLLPWEAVVRAEEGDMAGAANSLASATRLTGLLDDGTEYFLPDPRTLNRMTCCNHLSHCLAYVLSRGDMTDAALATLYASLVAAEDAGVTLPTLVGERCRDYNALNGPDDGRRRAWPLPRWLGPLREADHLGYIRTVHEFMAVMKLPLDERYVAAQRLNRKAGRTSSSLRPATRRIGFTCTGFVLSDAGCALQLRTMRTAMAVERFRRAKGRLPDKLNELVPEFFSAVPVDPCDGKPIKYRKQDKGYAIYSVGDDGRDDGGPQSSSDDGNFAFTMAR
jgi:hypothetical protein